MEQYIVSARKYRPSTFHSVVGQDTLTSTLKNAIQNKHLAHAYLFCGPRGVGKTTCARIFAKAINCMQQREDGEPCNECESCKSFNAHGSFNIHELDAASNNKVDDIRNLVDQVRIPPPMGKYSVYIVDEVHMLSTGAFNAFLKTLEEPPAHVIFILATTERHKILPTILSRCQVYNFNRIKVLDTVKYLHYVAGEERVKVDAASLTVVAQKSDGAMRDALSIFDQLVSFCGSSISYEQAIEHLNVLDYDYYFKMVDCFLDFKVKDALLILDEILNKGFDAQHFTSGLASHFRDLLVSKDVATIKLLDVSEDIEAKYKEQNVKCPNAFIYKALELANDCDYSYRLSRNKRLLVEILLIKICGLTQSSAEVKKDSPKLPKIAVAAISDGKPSATSVIEDQEQVSVNKEQGVVQKEHVTGNRARFSILKSEPKEESTHIESTESITVNEHNNENLKSPLEASALQVAWIRYANSLVGLAHVTNAMKNFMPEITSPNSIKVVLVNGMQQVAILEHKRAIEMFLAKELNNSQIALEIAMDDGTQYAKEAFTPSEKLNKMMEKNANFRVFKQALGLDI